METAEPQGHPENTATEEISPDRWKALQEHSSSKPVLNLTETALPASADSPVQTQRALGEELS